MTHRQLYTEHMLSSLSRNPELTEFLRDYPTAERAASGGISADEKQETCPLLLQFDPRWGYAPYGDDDIAFSGCGPTALSMVIFSLTRDAAATPDALAAYALAGGYYVPGTGTAWSLMTDAAAHYGLSVSQLPLDEETMRAALTSGKLLICSMGPGDFTTSGHFIVIRGCGGGGFYVNDPFSRRNSEKTWSYETLAPQIANIWAYKI